MGTIGWLGDEATTHSAGMATAPLPCAGHSSVDFLGTVVVVVGWVVVVVGVVVVVVEGIVVVVVVGVVVVVVVGARVVVVVTTVVVVVDVVVVVVGGGVVAQVGRTGDVAIAGVSLTGSRTNRPLSAAASIAERRIHVGGRYFTEQT